MIARMIRLMLIAATFGLVQSAAAEDAADFYRGKTLTVLIGSGSGGGVDQVSRAVVRHLGKHVPGNPIVVPKNMGGGGGVQVLNYVNAVAPKDGATIGFVLPSLVFDPLFAGKQAGEGFDPKTMQWLGGPARYASVAIAWNPWTRVRKADDLLTQELVVGASAAASSSGADAFIMRNILGFKFRVVTGYPSGARHGPRHAARRDAGPRQYRLVRNQEPQFRVAARRHDQPALPDGVEEESGRFRPRCRWSSISPSRPSTGRCWS